MPIEEFISYDTASILKEEGQILPLCTSQKGSWCPFSVLQVRLKHRDTQALLTSLEHARFGHPIGGQQEVCAVKSKGKNSEWQTAEGVYLPVLTEGEEGGAQGNDEL